MKVKLESIERTGGNLPTDISRIGKEYYVLHVMVGNCAILQHYENADKALKTSYVKNVSIHQGNFTIETENTKYYFEIVN